MLPKFAINLTIIFAQGQGVVYLVLLRL